MSRYDAVLSEVKSLTLADKLRLFEELKALVNEPVVVEGDDEVISSEEIVESEAAWQDYKAGRDSGISSKELKQKLLGEKLD